MDNNKPAIKTIPAMKNPKEWTMDEKGYFLIDPKTDENLIYAHHYSKEKVYEFSIQGEDAESIYYTILRKDLVSNFMHAAYLGSELQKAELFLRLKKGKYVQDKPLTIENDN